MTAGDDASRQAITVGTVLEAVSMNASTNPDVALLGVCRRLAAMQAEWQHLYDLASAEDEEPEN
ncbi:MAG: hypothetical protein ACRYFY_22890 [Janthinobacterium lividum]